MKKRIIIIRHGNTFEKNATIRRVGVTDIPLVAAGKEQVEILSEHFQTQGIHPDIILSSPLKRTLETATILQKSSQPPAPILLHAGLREIDYGPDEFAAEADVQKRLGTALDLWNDLGIMPKDWPNSVHDIKKKWEEILCTCVESYPEHRCIFIVTSNGLARFLPQLSVLLNPQQRPQHLNTAHYGILEYDNTVWQVLSWNNSYVAE